MYMKKIFFYFLAISALLFSCKKKKSDSAYSNAYITFSKFKYAIRDSIEIDTAEYGIYGYADFLPYTEQPTGGVFINGEQFDGPNPSTNHQSNAQYQWGGYNATEIYLNNYKVARFSVISPNNIPDMEYSVDAMLFYDEMLPYQISCTTGFSVPINANLLPDADSINIHISGDAAGIDTSFAIVTGNIVISPTALSIFGTNNHTAFIYISAWKNYTFSTGGRSFNIKNISTVKYDIHLNP